MTETTTESPAVWPTCEEGVTVDRMLQVIGLSGQDALLAAERQILSRANPQLAILAVARSVAFMHALRVIRDLDPDRALDVARWYWRMTEGGDGWGEALWDRLIEAGLTPEQIQETRD